MNAYIKTNDLTHLVGPLSEDSIVRCLEARFFAQLYQTKIGPTVVAVNCNRHTPSGKVLCDVQWSSGLLRSLMSDAMANYLDTGSPQALIVSGENGSGKTHCAMQCLRQLFDMAGGGPETDAFKHLSATLTVLRSLGSAATISNPESTRMGYFIENFITDSAIYRTKIHCYFIDQSRLCSVHKKEKNYHIFYQMFAGLTQQEKAKLHLTGYSLHNVRYLSSGLTQCNNTEDMARFEAWKASLSILGIPLTDVLRIMAAVLLLGNIEFVEGTGLELDIVGSNEMKAVAALLGISGVALYRGFTIKTRNSHGQVCKSLADVNAANKTRDNLARTLYVRTVMIILKRANNLRRLNPTLNSSLSLSMESMDLNTHTGTARGTSLSSSISHGGHGYEKTRHTGFISIVDMLGFETSTRNRLEQLCMNLCAEKIQQFYIKQVFQDTSVALRQENIQANVDMNHCSNDPIIELISSQRSGILDILDAEGMQPRCTTSTFISQVKSQHRINNYFFEPLPKENGTFGVRHFAGKVVYDATDFLDTNRDLIPDDIVCIFSKQNCNFGFASHLFSKEIRVSSDSVPGPRGLKHRILPRSENKACISEGQSTLSQDFQNRLDSMLNILSHAKPHFVTCLKSNDSGEIDLFDRDVVIRQIQSLNVFETVQLMAGGLPHKLKYRIFNKRYQMFLGHRNPYRQNSQYDQCKAMLNCFLRAMDESRLPYVSTHWAMGDRHIFYSEGTRQQLEAVRFERMHQAATMIQTLWKGHQCRLSWPARRKQMQNSHDARNSKMKITSSQKDSTTQIIINERLLQKLAKINNIDLEKQPRLPSKRNYSIRGNFKLSYPQSRILNENFPRNGPHSQMFLKGEEVNVIGPSPQRGHLVVESRNLQQHVPYHLLDLQTIPEAMGMDI